MHRYFCDHNFLKMCIPATYATVSREAVAWALHHPPSWQQCFSPLFNEKKVMVQLLGRLQNPYSLRTSCNFMLADCMPHLPSIHLSLAEEPCWFHWSEKDAFPFDNSPTSPCKLAVAIGPKGTTNKSRQYSPKQKVQQRNVHSMCVCVFVCADMCMRVRNSEIDR